MSHSLVGADRRTHCKIVAIACAGAVGLSMLAGAMARSETAAPSAHAQANKPVLKNFHRQNVGLADVGSS